MSVHDDLDRRLRAYAARWRAEQPPTPGVDPQTLMGTKRRAGGWFLVSASVLAVAVTIVAVLLIARPDTQPSGSPAGTDTCPAGEERPVLPGLPKSVVLGCAQLPDGRKVAILSAHESGGQCLQIVGLDDRARECGLAPSAMVPPPRPRAIVIQVHAQRNESAPIEVFGDTSAEATTVELTYTRDGSLHEARAAHIQVTDSDVLAKAGIAEPFGYFVAEVPPDTSHVTVTALDADGQRLGSDGLTPLPWSRWSTSMVTGLIVWDGSSA